MLVTQPGGPWLVNVASPAHPVHTGTLTVPALGGIAHPQVVSIAVSPDGSTVAAGISTSETSLAAGVVLLWNLSTRTVAGVIPEAGLTGSLAFTPDGRSLVTARQIGTVSEWDITRHVKTAVLQPASSATSPPLAAVAVSPDGKTIAFGTENAQGNSVIKLWSTTTRQVTQTVQASPRGASSVAFNPDGTQLASSALDGTVRLWDI